MAGAICSEVVGEDNELEMEEGGGEVGVVVWRREREWGGSSRASRWWVLL